MSSFEQNASYLFANLVSVQQPWISVGNDMPPWVNSVTNLLVCGERKKESEVLKVKNFIRILVTCAFVTGTAAIAATWTGQISDSMCGAHHKTMAEHGKKLSARDCTEACVKNGGKYVFVSKGKVYNIENQDFAGLTEHAGHTVKLTGDMNGDSIKVSDLAMPQKSSKK